MRRVRLVVNPASGTDRAPVLLPAINDRLRALAADVDITLTSSEQDAEVAAARAVAEHCDALYVAGGDGTLNAVVRGLLQTNYSARRPPIGIIPLGTGNDFAKALALGEDPESALAALAEPRVIDVDVGMVNDRPFVNTSAGGFVADVSETVTEGLKDVAGKLAYLIGGARALLGSEPFRARLVRHDDDNTAAAASAPDLTEPFEVQMFVVCNARLIGGGYEIAPEALIDDGRLDVILVPRLPTLEFVGVLQRIAAGRRNGPGLWHFQASAFDLEFDRTIRMNTDGEVAEASRCGYRVHARFLRFFCGPAPMAIGRPVAWAPAP